jgi:hypothetical protein
VNKRQRHVLITHGPGDVIINAYLMRPGEHRLWIASSAVHDDVRRKAAEVARAEHVPVIEDPTFVPLPPLEPKWFRPASNRLLMEIPSVPELRRYLDKCLAYFLLFGEGTDGEYRASRAVADAEQALQDAQWRLACASWQWCQTPSFVRPEFAWFSNRLVEALRFGERQSGYRTPGKVLVLRTPGVLA